MKYILIFILLMSISVFLNAETNKSFNFNTNTECPIDQPEEGIGHCKFWGVLDIWETPAGAVIIECDPPFFTECFTLFWSTDNPSEKTVRLNDANQTEISVTSDPVITTSENGEQIHTFTR